MKIYWTDEEPTIIWAYIGEASLVVTPGKTSQSITFGSTTPNAAVYGTIFYEKTKYGRGGPKTVTGTFISQSDGCLLTGSISGKVTDFGGGGIGGP